MLENGELDALEASHRQSCLDSGAKVREKYPEVVNDLSEFEWGMINGKLSALRWALGDEWDFLDT